MNLQCDKCIYRLTCNRDSIKYSSTGGCDYRQVGEIPIQPKITTPPDERYNDIWNW